MELALLLFGMTAVTFLARYAPFEMLQRGEPPAWFARALRYVPIAAFAALIAPDLFAHGDVLVFDFANPRFIAGSAAFVVAALSRRVLLTIGVGMTALWALSR